MRKILAIVFFLALTFPSSAEEYSAQQNENIHHLQILLEKAESNDPVAQSNLGHAFAEGKLIPRNEEEAYFWYSLALASLDGDLTTLISSADQGAYFQKQEVCRLMLDKGNLQATEACKRYAEKDFPLALQSMCSIYIQGNLTVERDYQEAAKWCGLAAFTRSQESQGYLGVLYAHGLGIEQSYKNAYFWFARLGKQEKFLSFYKPLRDQVAQRLTLDEKKAIDENLNLAPPVPTEALQHYGEKGLKCITSSELQYFGPCEFVPGAPSGSGLTPNSIRTGRANITLTVEEYESVIKRIENHQPNRDLINKPAFPQVDEITFKAEHGDADAQFKLAELYAGGVWIPQDRTKAVEWFRKSAEQGNANAQLQIAAFYNWGGCRPEKY